MTASKPAADLGALGLLRRIASEHARRHLGAYLAAAVLLGVGAAATAVSAWLLKPILNHMFGGASFTELRAMSWAVAGLFTLRGLATFGSMALLSRTGNRIVAAIQRQLFDALLLQDMRFFHERHSADFMTRLSVAANGMRDALQVAITSISRDALTALGLILVMVTQDPVLAAIALTTLPVGMALLGRLIRRIRRFARRSFDGSARIAEILQETVLGARIVKSFSLESVMRARMASAATNAKNDPGSA